MKTTSPLMAAAAVLYLGSTPAGAAGYTQSALTVDAGSGAPHADSLMVNPWGLSRPDSRFKGENYWWTANRGTGTTTLYDAAGASPPLTVTIPSRTGVGAGSPTGTVDFNNDFVFVTEDGAITSWLSHDKPAGAAALSAGMRAHPDSNTNCGRCHVTTAAVKHRNADASYSGVTVAKLNGNATLYAANSASGAIELYDANYAAVTLPAGAFTDPTIPASFTPNNVQTAGGRVWVVYSDGDTGYVDGYAPDGTLKVRLEQGAWFSDPWGVALAPRNFGSYGNALLIGNTGSGTIAAFNPANGKFLGYLQDSSGKPLANPGLWALSFGNGNKNSGPTNVLYITVGTSDFQHGLFAAVAPN